MRPQFLVVLSTGLVAAGGGILFASSPHPRVIAAFATSLEARNHSQRHNAILASDQLQSVIIAPGEEFSFNKKVGSFSRDAGYRRAPVSYNGQLIDDWGGGVCQVSTTVYNAALLSGMKITERHRHRFSPSYVPPGRDAAVAYTNIDLRFVNPHKFPVRLVTNVKNGMIQASFYADRDMPVKPIVYSEIDHFEAPAKYTFGSSGASRVRNSGKAGFGVTVYRVSGDRKERISRDNYPSMGKVIQFEG